VGLENTAASKPQPVDPSRFASLHRGRVHAPEAFAARGAIGALAEPAVITDREQIEGSKRGVPRSLASSESVCPRRPDREFRETLES
jgi:hypothetical protein